MSEEAISGSDMEPGLDSEEEEDQGEEEEEGNDGDDEEDDADPPQNAPLSVDNESGGEASAEGQQKPSSTSPPHLSSQPRPLTPPSPLSQSSSSPDSHSHSPSLFSTRKRVSKPSHLRRNIRKLLKEHQLEAVTQVAQQEELERRKRLEQQRKDFPAPPLPECPPGEVVVHAGPVSQAQVERGEVICLDSSGSEDDAHSPPLPQQRGLSAPVIELSSGEDDALRISSESANEEEETPGAEERGGAHVNDDLNQPDALGRVLVNINHPANEKDLFLSPQLARAVKPHQIGGIRFLYDNLVESLERCANSSGFGCILAHSMGLGKTLQVISFIDILLRHTGARTVLTIVPVNTLQNWLAEFNTWLPAPEALSTENDPETIAPRTFKVHVLSDEHRTTVSRAKVVSEWSEGGGVLLMGYEMFRLLSLKKSFVTGRKKKSKKPAGPVIIDLDEEERQQELLKDIERALSQPGPDVVICDEGHRIKNFHSGTSQALKSVRSRRRVVLTGYPLQNSLTEYWCMVDFVRPDFLGSRQEFSNMFERPILNGQCMDSTPKDVRLMRYRSHVLHSLLEGFVQRRGHDVLKTHLPLKEETVIMVHLSPLQRALYTQFMRRFREAGSSGWLGLNPLKAFCVCCKIWNHPDVLYEALQKENLANEQDLDLDDPTPSLKTKPPESSHSKMAMTGLSLGMLQDRTNQVITYEWAKDIMANYQTGVLENSPKMVLLFHLIEESVTREDKILVFSQSLSTLSVIEEFLAKRPMPPCRVTSESHTWIRNVTYYRLDGSTSSSERERLINQFNSPENHTTWLFLLSTRAGCLGVNLTGANRVVVFDASWNPCHDAQAVCRVYRYGQRKACHIYRLVCDFTLERKIYDRQVSKQGMSDRVVDELNPVLNFTRREVESLLHFVEEEPGPAPLLLDPQDKMEDLIQQACNIYPHLITKRPFPHESLLMERKETRLTRAEKKAAKKGYEDEKRASIPHHRPSFPHNRPSYPYYPPTAHTLANAHTFSQRSCRLLLRPDEKPVASVRPVQATPIPMMPRQVPMAHAPSMAASSSAGVGLPVGYLQKAGVYVQKVVTTTDIMIPGSDSTTDVQARISAGESVHVIKGSKGTYIRTSDGRIFAFQTNKSRPGEEHLAASRAWQPSHVRAEQKRVPLGDEPRPLSPNSPEQELRRFAAVAEAGSGQGPDTEGGGAESSAQSGPGALPSLSVDVALDLRSAKRPSKERLRRSPSAKRPAAPPTNTAPPFPSFPLGVGLGPLGPSLLGSMLMGTSPFFPPQGQLGNPRMMFPMTPDPFGTAAVSSAASSSSSSSSSASSAVPATGPSLASLAVPPLMLPAGFPLSYGQSLVYPNPLLSSVAPPSSSLLSHLPPSLQGALGQDGGSSSDDDVIEVTRQ
ncbi:helicase ARIP4-like isoform X2 [Anguilla anguilla]|uniref:helicase ARIP4-like isoform X2 n=1 Tax=Anguilla anguilla TaxID=7936 RepID=UPI0015AF2E0B|nr:helicase ARIP4-like isoform X2 [Anguilla anguilla]